MREEITQQDAEDFQLQVNRAVSEFDDLRTFLTRDTVKWVWEQYTYRLAEYGAIIVWCDSRMAEIELANKNHISRGIIDVMFDMANPEFDLNQFNDYKPSYSIEEQEELLNRLSNIINELGD